MNIFAAAADYASWITLLGVKPGDAQVGGYFDQNIYRLCVPASGYYLLDPEPNLATDKIIQMDQYISARYVQSGGISANFKIHSTLADGPEDYTLVCPANEDDTKSLIRKLPNTKTGDDLPNPKLGLIEISLEA